MKKSNFIVLFACLSSLFSLSGCKPGNSSSNFPETNKTEENKDNSINETKNNNNQPDDSDLIDPYQF